MAEGFARCYGSDVMVARSAGLNPAPSLAPFTRKVMAEKNIDLGDAFPKSIADLGAEPFDLIINLSGFPLPPSIVGNVREWKVRDPMGEKEERYRETSNEIETLVMRLILELRNVRKQWADEFDSKPSSR
jgi:protein-tyrosine-phosphatase